MKSSKPKKVPKKKVGINRKIDKIKEFWRAYDKLRELMEAQKIQYFSNLGAVTDARQVAALDIQVKAVVEFKKLLGLDEPEKREITGKDGGPIQLDQQMNQEALKNAIKSTT